MLDQCALLAWHLARPGNSILRDDTRTLGAIRDAVHQLDDHVPNGGRSPGEVASRRKLGQALDPVVELLDEASPHRAAIAELVEHLATR